MEETLKEMDHQQQRLEKEKNFLQIVMNKNNNNHEK
jgi:hypothetical protein